MIQALLLANNKLKVHAYLVCQMPMFEYCDQNLYCGTKTEINKIIAIMMFPFKRLLQVPGGFKTHRHMQRTTDSVPTLQVARDLQTLCKKMSGLRRRSTQIFNAPPNEQDSVPELNPKVAGPPRPSSIPKVLVIS